MIICGGRDYTMTAYDWLRIDAIHMSRGTDRPDGLTWPSGPIECVYEGGADGADICGRAWAESRGVPVIEFPADWYPGGGPLDRSAGPRRNDDMRDGRHATGKVPEPELVIATPGGIGTADMVGKMRAAGRAVFELREPWQRWGRDDVDDLRQGIHHFVGRWALKGGGGPPIISAHLLKVGGRIEVPADLPVVYCGRGTLAGPDGAPLAGTGFLGNPFKVERVADGAADVFDELNGKRVLGVPFDVVLGWYRGYLRQVYQADPRVRDLLLTMRPWTLLICWCPPSSPCHATVIADAAMQAQAAADLRRRGLAMPAKHWSAYKRPPARKTA